MNAPSPVRPRRKIQVLSITERAAERVKQIMAASETPILGLRVGVKKGGCAGMSYTMGYATEISPFDEVIEERGVKVIVDPGAVMFLLGAQMDYKVDKLAAHFVFDNPNQTSACGCGESVALKPAEMPA